MICLVFVFELYRAREALKSCLPDAFNDQNFMASIRSEEGVQKWLSLLIRNVNEGPPQQQLSDAASGTAGGGGGLAEQHGSRMNDSSSSSVPGSTAGWGAN
jgi:hypothetical protein